MTLNTMSWEEKNSGAYHEGMPEFFLYFYGD